MADYKDYSPAHLTENLIDEIKDFESKLRTDSNKEVVIIAYEKEN